MPVDDTNANDVKTSVVEEIPLPPVMALSPTGDLSDPHSNASDSDDKENLNKTQNGNDPDKEKEILNFKNLSKEEQDKLMQEDEEKLRLQQEKRLQEEEMEYEKARKRIEEARRKRAEEQKLKESMFWRIYHLVRHSENRTLEDFFHRAVMVCFMLKSLKKTKYFDDYKRSGVGKSFHYP